MAGSTSATADTRTELYCQFGRGPADAGTTANDHQMDASNEIMSEKISSIAPHTAQARGSGAANAGRYLHAAAKLLDNPAACILRLMRRIDVLQIQERANDNGWRGRAYRRSCPRRQEFMAPLPQRGRLQAGARQYLVQSLGLCRTRIRSS